MNHIFGRPDDHHYTNSQITANSLLRRSHHFRKWWGWGKLTCCGCDWSSSSSVSYIKDGAERRMLQKNILLDGRTLAYHSCSLLPVGGKLLPETLWQKGDQMWPIRSLDFGVYSLVWLSAYATQRWRWWLYTVWLIIEIQCWVRQNTSKQELRGIEFTFFKPRLCTHPATFQTEQMCEDWGGDILIKLETLKKARIFFPTLQYYLSGYKKWNKNMW